MLLLVGADLCALSKLKRAQAYRHLYFCEPYLTFAAMSWMAGPCGVWFGKLVWFIPFCFGRACVRLSEPAAEAGPAWIQATFGH
jgi:hypothetical protein